MNQETADKEFTSTKVFFLIMVFVALMTMVLGSFWSAGIVQENWDKKVEDFEASLGVPVLEGYIASPSVILTVESLDVWLSYARNSSVVYTQQGSGSIFRKTYFVFDSEMNIAYKYVLESWYFDLLRGDDNE